MRHLALLALLLFAVGSAAVACGGGDDDRAALEQYFQNAKDLDVTYEERALALEQRLGAELAEVTEEAEAVAPVRENVAGNLANFEDFVDDLDELRPPDTIAVAHDEAILALRAVIDRLQSLVDDLQDAQSVSDIEPLFADAELAAAQARADETCLALQAIATDREIEIDIGCEN